MDKKTKAKQNNQKKAWGNRFGKRILAPFLITFFVVVGIGMIPIILVARNRTDTEEREIAKGQAAEKTKSIVEKLDVVQLEKIPVETNDGEETKEESEEEDIVLSRYGDILADEIYMRDNYVFSVETKSEEQVTVTFAGDILFDSGYSVMNTLRANGNNLSSCIAPELLQIMRDSDIMMINNEFPYSDRGTPLEDKMFTFRAAKESVSFLNEMGVDIVSLANNHAYDYGEDALVDTFDVLEQAGIVYVGAGRNRDQAMRTAYYVANDIKIAFLSATQIERLDRPDTKEATQTSPGVFRCLDNKALLEQIRHAKENSDFVIVYIHWGTENEEKTDWIQDKQAPEMAEAGADLILGDHPHCLQKIGISGGVPVIYSLGNFWFNSKTLDTCLVQLTLNNAGIKSLQFIPCLQSGCRTTMLQGAEKSRVIEYMNDLSGPDTLNADGYLSKYIAD